ncbi:ER-golgi trafficking TRAPP I complex 85 kDa subunit-domain-containing protein [Tirmania nivea]|nr:ER-golgi trafficking TRAPP I complex 85 kDa subunit-domain-containing protein [Tirmania nivea]
MRILFHSVVNSAPADRIIPTTNTHIYTLFPPVHRLPLRRPAAPTDTAIDVHTTPPIPMNTSSFSPPPPWSWPNVAIPSSPSGIYLRPSTRSSTTSLNSLFASQSLNNLPQGTEDDFRQLVTQAFVPHIGVHVSEDTDALARDKGFGSFKEMIRPFGEKVQGRVTVRDSQGVSASYEDFGIRIRGLSDLAAVGPEERWGTANNSINGQAGFRGGGGDGGGGGGWGGGAVVGPNTKEPGWMAGGNIQHVEDLAHAYVDHAEELAGVAVAGDDDVPTTGRALYLLYLRRLLSGMPMSPHETFAHPTACVIAISSRNPAPIETLKELYATGSGMIMPAYVNNDYLRYYVLVHDEDKDDIMKSNALFDQMKKHFGLHCHLLRLRSGRTVVTDDEAVPVPKCQWFSAAEELADIRMRDGEEDDPDPTLYLPESEISGLRTMVREMVAQSIIPFMERCIATWNDQVASRRKGLSGRFISMSKRYFGASRGSNNTSMSNYDAATTSYVPSSNEAKMRKLADYAFMLRDWKLAWSCYDLLRTDFANDKAWRYHAGAQEMTVLSLLLTGQPLTTKLRQDTIDPILDLAIYSYLTRCTASYSALRCVLVSVELLRSRGGGAADDAARWAIRALEMNALGSIGHALVTERVSACYAVRKGVGSGAWGSRRRKTAMWRVLAAKEWMELGKRGRAKRCLEEAAPMYEKLVGGWKGIGDVIEWLKRESGWVDKGRVLDEERLLLMSPEDMSVDGGVLGGLVNDVERVNDDDEFVDS